jgi:hypothetical protein
MKLLVKNLFPLFILFFVLMGCGSSKPEKGSYEKRKKVAEVLNDQFDLRDRVRELAGLRTYDCRFQLRAQYSNNRILLARLCQSSPPSASISDILTPQNVALIKDAGFEEVVLYDRHEDEVLGREVYP